MKRLILLFFLSVAAGPWLKGQECFSLFVDQVAGSPGEEVCVPVRADGVEGLVSMQFSLGWDASKLQLTGVANLALPQLSTNNFNLDPAFNSAGQTALSWFDISTPGGLSLPDSSILFELCFEVLSPGGYASIHFAQTIAPYEFTALPGNVLPTYALMSGGVSAEADMPAFSGACFSLGDCTDGGAIIPQLSNSDQVVAYNWHQGGQSISTSDFLGGAAPGLYKLNVTDVAGRELQADFSLGAADGVFVSGYDLSPPTTCGGADGSIEVFVEGGSGSYDIAWSNGQSGSVISGLSPGVYIVWVTDLETNCDYTAVYVIPAGGELLTAYSYACTQFEDQPAVVSITCAVWDGGGLPPYTFEWSNGYTEVNDWVSTLEDVPSGLAYGLTITDASGCSYEPLPAFAECDPAVPEGQLSIGEAIVAPGAEVCLPVSMSGVQALSSFSTGIGWDPDVLSFTGVNEGSLPSLLDFGLGLEHAGQGLLSIDWATDVPEGEFFSGPATILFEICFDAVGAPGSSTAVEFDPEIQPTVLELTGGVLQTSLSDGACLISGGAESVGLQWGAKAANVGESACLDVTVSNFTDVAGVQFSTDWDPTLIAFDTLLLSGNLPALNPNANFNLQHTDEGNMAVTWFDPALSSLSLPDGTPLFSLCFTALGPEGFAPVSFSNQPALIEVSNENEVLPVQVQHGGVDMLQPEVWPGDTDTDGLVSHYDLLNIGLGYGSAGPGRENASINWAAQYAPAWEGSTPGTGVNFKHLDTNGDGLIDAADTLALVQNWGEEVNFTPGEAENRLDGASIFIEPDTVVLGDEAVFNIILGEEVQPAQEIYGLAFSIVYDTSVVVPGSGAARFMESWLGQEGTDLLGVSKDQAGGSRVDVALTRTDGLNRTGAGTIGQLHITIQDVIFARAEAYELPFAIENIRVINALEEEQPVVPQSTVALVLEAVTALAPGPDALLEVYPNPARERLQVSVKGLPVDEARLWSAAGQLVLEGKGEELDVSQVPSGTYWLEARSAGKVYRELIVVQ